MNNSEVGYGLVTLLIASLAGLEGDALIGAFAGGSLYAMKSKEISRGKRFGYLVISIIAGYYFRNQLVNFGIEHSGLAAFLIATFVIAIVSWGYEQIHTVKITDFFNGGKRND